MVKVSVLGPSGLHLDLVLEDGARCLALKEELAELEGVPVERQNLLFAGHTLRDDATLESYSLSDYNLRDDGITITLQVSTVGRVFLRLPDGHLTASDIEEDTPVEAMVALLNDLAGFEAVKGDYEVIVKRVADGTKMYHLPEVGAGTRITEFKSELQLLEGVVPLLTFEAEPNLGNLIVHVHPTTSEPAPGPGLARETFTQSPLVKKDAGNGHQLMSWGQLQRELCLQP